MNTELGWISLLPSLLAIVFAIATRKVIWALLGGVLLAHVLLFMPNVGDGLWSGTVSLGETLIDPSNQLIWGFTLAIGALFGVLERGGTFTHFVRALERKQIVPTKRRARLFTWLLGVAVFIESNVSIMTSGTTSRPVYDKLGISRQKLAYLVDSTCAPVCILIPLNAWGAFNLGLIGNQGVADPLTTLIYAVVLNFYAIVALVMAFGVAWTGWSFGPMRRYEREARLRAVAAEEEAKPKGPGRAPVETIHRGAVATVLVSLITMVLLVPIMLYITGDGSIVRGKGMVSVFVAIVTALIIAIIGSAWSLRTPAKTLVEAILRGAWKILPLAVILWLAITLGDATRTLGSGAYLADILNEALPTWILPALIFLLAALTAFAIGSSWGTFAIMLPLAIPLAMSLGLPVPLLVAAALAGGIFGDHASPISDTTIIASLASGVDHIEHVQTQLPYALLAAFITTVLYVIAGLMM
ncbi:sodium:proton antiporter [Aliidiomarina halalkaliphila]|uniref:Sodium:proton antiporter n=1 Tax=Aliidiomarina halalkaliphila TaxID=2593535 RepID=A0A552X5J9_9GAMM|nr:Na+/H+ antiporter NhaC family protein [Aliidiomarina halalkaliphila]TRW50301.1 sodium:proton antiporter [Aliidiomarina halalkaliphila]